MRYLGTNDSLNLMERNGRWHIVVRTHDLSGTDYDIVALVEHDSVPMIHNECGIPFLYEPPEEMKPFIRQAKAS